jgi:hypothetical protein
MTIKIHDRLSIVAVAIGLGGCLFSPSVHAQTVDLSAAVLAAHSNLPINNMPGSDLKQLLTQAQQIAASKSISTSDGISTVIFDEPSPGFTQATVEGLYQKLACSADAIIIAVPIASQFHLSASNTAIYGDWDMSVTAVLKDNQAATINGRTHIVVTRPGGTLSVGIGKMNAIEYDHQAFPLWSTGSTYLMFLRYVGGTNAFYPVDPFSTFVGDANNWHLARKAYNQNSLFIFSRGILEPDITQWVALCSH